VAAATANAARAEVGELVEFVERPVSASAAPAAQPGWVVTNPPYGARIDHGGDLRNLYARFGAIVRQRLPGWSVAMLVADHRLAAHSGLSLREAIRLANGGINVEVVIAEASRHTGRYGRPQS
jgi:putative N6-adenine-specific DNA methylase